MKLFEKIKVRTVKDKSRIIYVLGVPVLKYDIVDSKNKRYKFLLFDKDKVYKDKPFVYLKANSLKNYTITVLNNWIKIVTALNYDYVII